MENLAEIFMHRGKNYSLKEWKDTIKLGGIEEKIFKARCTGISICQLSNEDTQLAIDQIMLRVAAICGCALPNTDFFAKFIGEEIRIFILDFGYESLTLAEVLLAFRINAKGGMKYPGGQEVEHIQFTGKCLNVDYMASVLENYMIYRKTFDRSLQNKLDGYEL